MKPILLDTGVVVALLDRSERHHVQCASVVSEAATPFSHLRGGNCRELLFAAAALRALEQVLENVARRVFLIPFQLSRVATPVRNITRKYSDLPVDFADTCLIHLADELNTGEILTLDRDFAHYIGAGRDVLTC